MVHHLFPIGLEPWVSCKKYEGSHGQAAIAIPAQVGKLVSAHYLAKALFEHGDANIEIGLIKRANESQIAQLKVDSPALAPNTR